MAAARSESNLRLRCYRIPKDCAKAKGGARKGFPRFKRKADRADAFSFVGRECRFEPGRVRLPKVGWVRVRGLRLPDDAVPKVVAVTQEPDGWHVSVQFEAAPKSYAVPSRPVVGVDAGLLQLAILSDGARIEAPRLARKAEKRIRRLNRERDRRRKGSVNRRRTVARLARAHQAARNARRDHLHKATRHLVDTYGRVRRRDAEPERAGAHAAGEVVRRRRVGRDAAATRLQEPIGRAGVGLQDVRRGPTATLRRRASCCAAR